MFIVQDFINQPEPIKDYFIFSYIKKRLKVKRHGVFAIQTDFISTSLPMIDLETTALLKAYGTTVVGSHFSCHALPCPALPLLSVLRKRCSELHEPQLYFRVFI